MKFVIAIALLLCLWGCLLVGTGIALGLSPETRPAFAKIPLTTKRVEASVKQTTTSGLLRKKEEQKTTTVIVEKKDDNSVEMTVQEERLVNAVNRYRGGRGLAPLKPSPILMSVARYRAKVMHNGNAHCPNGVWPQEACNKAGYRGPVNEDFAKPFYPEEAVWAWGQSYGHAMAMKGYGNVNNRWVHYNYTEIGVGVYGDSNVAIFGRPTP